MPYPSEIRRVLMVTDAWQPQINGVVRTLTNISDELSAMGLSVKTVHPGMFRTVPCVGYPEIRLALASASDCEKLVEETRVDALHIATEGPLGWAMRRAAIRRGWQFTTAYHTRFPEYLHARSRFPLRWSYAALRRFHAPSHAVLVPSHHIIRNLASRGFQRLSYWGRGVDHSIFFPRPRREKMQSGEPIFLFAGRISIEKNIESFLQLDLPGQKWVAGDGPLLRTLRARYPQVRWFGALDQYQLADVYSQADVFVFPSKTDTFGLVMAEAMACGLPVAAFPVPGPLDVIGRSKAGVMSHDLREACLKCLELPKEPAIERASKFTWRSSAKQFADALVPMRTLPYRRNHYELAGHTAFSRQGGI